MDLTRFGKPSIILQRVGFGGWQLGNNDLWGPMSDAEGVALVRAAIDKGVNFFDTAPGYGGGKSEEIIGMAMGDDRDKLVINTKFGHQADGTSDWRIEAIEPAIRESIARLRTTYLDSVVLHNPSMDILRGETGHFKELARMKHLGLIRAFGVSVDTREELETVLDHVTLDVIELLFNLFFQAPADLFERIKARRIVLVTKVPLDSGWLSGKYDEQSLFQGIRDRWSPDVIHRRAHLVRHVKAIFGKEDISLPSLAFILSFEAVGCVIPGIKSIRQLNDNLAAAHYKLTEAELKAVRDLFERELRHHPLPW